MELHVSPKRRARQIAAYERSLNPCPGRTTAERERQQRYLNKIRERIDYWLQATDFRPMPWLPYEGLITEMDEDYQVEHFYAYKEGATNEDMCLVDIGLDSVKATNIVHVPSWYKTDMGRELLIVKPIHSPLPCDEWTRLPLTYKQWASFIPQMALSHISWSWVHAAREYIDDPFVSIGGFLGWYMSPAKRLPKKDDDADLCTGQIIYSHVIDEYLRNVNGE